MENRIMLMFLVQGGHPRFKGENLEKNKVIYTRLAELAAPLLN